MPVCVSHRNQECENPKPGGRYILLWDQSLRVQFDAMSVEINECNGLLVHLIPHSSQTPQKTISSHEKSQGPQND